LQGDGGPVAEPRDGGLDEDRHDVYNVTDGSTKGQSPAEAVVNAVPGLRISLITNRQAEAER
jgi:hypothetical protein